MAKPDYWSSSARGVGIVSGWAILLVGAVYLVVILAWVVLEATPLEPIGDPYLAVMEVLTIASGLSLVAFAAAVACYSSDERRLFGLASLMLGTAAAVLTMLVHFVQLTAVRQMWRSGELADYRLVWPSALFATEYFAWDVLVGLAMLLAAPALAPSSRAANARRALRVGGALCLAGVVGPISGRMALQNVAVVGYAVVLPVAAGLVARVFHQTPSSPSSAD